MVGSFSGQYYYSRQRQLFPGCNMNTSALLDNTTQGMLFSFLNVVSLLWSSWSFMFMFLQLIKNNFLDSYRTQLVFCRNGCPEYLETWNNKEDLCARIKKKFNQITRIVILQWKQVLLHWQIHLCWYIFLRWVSRKDRAALPLFIYAPPVQVIQYIDVICPGLNASDRSVADETAKYLHD